MRTELVKLLMRVRMVTYVVKLAVQYFFRSSKIPEEFMPRYASALTFCTNGIPKSKVSK